MNDFILGSGLIGGIAKTILNKNVLIPFKRSRFFYEFPLSDNHIVYNDKIVDYMKRYCENIPIIYKSSYSYNGMLIKDDIKEVRELYFKKVYDVDIDPRMSLLKTSVMTFPISTVKLHGIIQESLKSEIRNNIVEYGELKSINVKEKVIHFFNKTVPYNKIISTIPLNALLKYCGMNMDLKAKNINYYNIISPLTDLEGTLTCMICDPQFLFFKVMILQDGGYIFWTFDKLNDAYKYFSQFLSCRIEILEAFHIENAIPIGDVPDLFELEEKYSIYAVGSCAQWDDFNDVSTSISRLIRM